MQYHDAYNCGVALNDNWTVHLLVSIWSLGRRKHGLADKLKEATWDWIWRFHSKCFLGFERNANQRIQTSGIDSESFLRLETWTSKLNMKLKLKLFVKFERVCSHDPWSMIRKWEIRLKEVRRLLSFLNWFSEELQLLFFHRRLKQEASPRGDDCPSVDSSAFSGFPYCSLTILSTLIIQLIPYHSFLFLITPDDSILFIVIPYHSLPFHSL